MKRREVYDNFFSAKALFFAGLAIMPSLVFNPQTEARVVQFLFFCLLLLLSGKKINPVITFLTLFFIIAFNLIIPYGKVLFSVGAFKITSGALKAGIHRAVTLEALLMLSKVTIRQDLKIPGAFGEILGDSFRVFSVMMSKKNRIRGRNFFADIDSLLLELSKEDIDNTDVQITHTKPVGYFLLAVVILISWLPWLFILQGGRFYL
jgi:heptaprenyl diphosphate synthase